MAYQERMLQYADRLMRERQAAEHASSEESRRQHLNLAEMYRDRLIDMDSVRLTVSDLTHLA